MEGFSFSSSWRFLNWLPGFLLRRQFSASWFAAHTKIEITAYNERFTIHGGELPSVVFWIEITNNPHFYTVMDRLVLHLACNISSVQALFLNRTPLIPGEVKKIRVSAGITREQLAYLVHAAKHSSTHFRIDAEFDCKLRNFSVSTRDIDGVKPELMNVASN